MKQCFLVYLVCLTSFGVSAQNVGLSMLGEAKHEAGLSSRTLMSNYAVAPKKGKGLRFLFGFKTGASTANLQADEVSFTSAGRDFRLAVEQDEFSFHIGLFSQIRINKWTVQPEVLFRSARADYMLTELVSTEFISSIRTENYSYVDVPLMVAYRIGALRLQAGPVAKFYIDSNTELIGITDFSQSYQQVDYGYQTGIGLDIWRLVIDLKYDRDLDRLGDHMNFNGEPLDFNSTAGRFLFSIGYSLLSP